MGLPIVVFYFYYIPESSYIPLDLRRLWVQGLNIYFYKIWLVGEITIKCLQNIIYC